jgi:hypothetical protein
MNESLTALRGIALSVALCAATTLAWSDQPAPQQTSDGLQLQKQTAQRIVYLRPAASFSQYRRVAILDCYVEFQKNWQRDYNASVEDPEKRVSDADVKRMKDALAAEFKRVFTDELQKGGYQVVDTAAPDVLVLRPALVNVQVTAPDVMSAGIDATVIRSAGQMTLYLELFDSVTSKILARVSDAEADQQPFAQRASGVTNKAAADLVLRQWADELRGHLDAVRSKAG